MSSWEGKRRWEMNFRPREMNSQMRSVCKHHLKSCAPAHGEHPVWHVFNHSNQWGPHFEYYLHATDSLGGNYAAIFNGGNDSASNRKKYSSKHHQLLMDKSQTGLRVKNPFIKKLFSYGKTAICGSLRCWLSVTSSWKLLWNQKTTSHLSRGVEIGP